MAEEKKPIGELILPDGTRKAVFGTAGRFFVCEDCQFFRWRYPFEPAERPKKKKKGDESE